MASSVKTDVVIIGGGIMGASCAFRLSERGLKVAMLEAQVFIECLLCWEGRSVDPLKHLVAHVGSPVRPSDTQQLKRLQIRCVGDMRPATQINELALFVCGDGLVRRKRIDDFELVVLAALAEQFDRFLAR